MPAPARSTLPAFRPMLPAAARLSAPPARATALAEELEPVAAQVAELEQRVDRLLDSLTSTRRTFLTLRRQSVTLST